ncbi:hypothetical protein NJ7G_1913 [Natrinema sp. J7-2]|nr:hypothetical protein NJ7G_1913 [Natrinema sp. J7-2]
MLYRWYRSHRTFRTAGPETMSDRAESAANTRADILGCGRDTSRKDP